MATETNVPPEFESVLTALAEQPDNVRAMWRYAIVLVMIDDEKARVMGTRIENKQEFVAVRTIAGDEFEIERPAMTEETEQLLLEQIRAIVRERDDRGNGD